MTVSDDLGVFRPRRVYPLDVLLRNDENVGGRLRIDVLKGKDAIVFVDFLRWNLAVDDFAEEAVGVGH